MSKIERIVGRKITGLGEELVTNGTFDTDVSGWTDNSFGGSSISWNASGYINLNVSAASENAIADQSIVTVVGQTYVFFIAAINSVNSTAIFVGTSQGNNNLVSQGIGTAGSYSYIFTATTTTTHIRLYSNNGGGGAATASLDNISVKEIPGNHAIQDVNTDYRPTLARRPASGKRNLLTRTEDFSSTVWTKDAGLTVTADNAADPLGETTADTLNMSTQYHGVRQSVDLVSGSEYTLKIWARRDSGSNNIHFWDQSSGASLGSYSPTNEWAEYSVTFTATGTTDLFVAQDRNATGQTGLEVWGAQIETGSTTTAYQKVTTQYDVTESGQADKWYLANDQVDDDLVVTLPDLGTDATEWLADENGTTINTGQTIGAGDRSLPTSEELYSYGVIDRALTASETASLTTYLDRARGAA